MSAEMFGIRIGAHGSMYDAFLVRPESGNTMSYGCNTIPAARSMLRKLLTENDIKIPEEYMEKNERPVPPEGGVEMPKYWRAKEGVRGLHSGAIVELVDVREFLYVRGSNGPSTVYEYCPKESLEPLTVPPEVAAILEKAEKEINELCSMEGDEMISLMRRTVLAAVGVK